MLYQMDNQDNIAKAEALYQKLKTAGYYSESTVLEYDKCIELNPKHVGALWQAACFYNGDYDYPGHGQSWDQFNCQNRQKALEYLKKIIQIDPKFGLAYKKLTEYSASDNQKCLQYYLEYLNYYPEDWHAIVMVGNLYRSMNRKEEAKSCYSKCLNHNQNAQGALIGLAKVYEDEGNFKGALQLLHRCMDSKHLSTIVLCHIAHVYDSMGNVKEALNYYRKCNQIDSYNKEAKTYLNKHLSKH